MIEPRLVLSLRPPAVVLDGRAKFVRVKAEEGILSFPAASPGLRRAFQLLEGGASEEELARIVGGDGDEALASWYYSVAALERHGALTYDIRDSNRLLARAVIMSPYFTSGSGVVAAGERWILSRFAYVHRADGVFVVESPMSCAKIELLDPVAMTLLGALATPATASDLAAVARKESRQTATDFLALLEYSGMLVRVDAKGRSTEDATPALRTWSFADMLFHGRSRGGRHDERFDVFRFLGEMPSLPAVKPPMSPETIELYVPDLEDLTVHDIPFTRVLEERRSVRTYDETAITAEQLGEFLYRAARVKRLIEPDGERILYQASARPYPGGGACYELELYIAINRCEGLPRGLYHYDPLHHHLEIIPGGDAHIATFMQHALSPAQLEGPRQVLIILAARFQRMSWKYSAGAYAVILKNVGVLYQTMYLVATAMGLAPCGIGSGDSELFARAIGTRFHEETSVGEFMLGTKPR